ncbi:NAD(P)H-dependent oxidoreductase [Massilia sp. TSP1-1-2]|uniref:glutathione-regulated potassium-efflux system oxidoreductase KefF n=1 Tax=Massilia sp. TSP1-1-2 TaxID=2804649 RepID=UPI003CFB4EC9
MRKNILVLYAHPSAHLSRVNARLAEAARAVEGVQVHALYDTYPDFYIDVAREQTLVAAADIVVFLHPIQWYSMPSLLKEWVDAVLLPGWAYGAGGHALDGKLYWLVATTGSAADAYSAAGPHGRSFDAYLAPFAQTAAVCGMRWELPHILHGAHHASEAQVQAHVDAFTARLAAFSALPAHN